MIAGCSKALGLYRPDLIKRAGTVGGACGVSDNCVTYTVSWVFSIYNKYVQNWAGVSHRLRVA